MSKFAPAFPHTSHTGGGEFAGLNKRELLAAMAMQGILARQEIHLGSLVHGTQYKTPRGIAYQAARMADALLTELSETAAEAGGEG